MGMGLGLALNPIHWISLPMGVLLPRPKSLEPVGQARDVVENRFNLGIDDAVVVGRRGRAEPALLEEQLERLILLGRGEGRRLVLPGEHRGSEKGGGQVRAAILVGGAGAGVGEEGGRRGAGGAGVVEGGIVPDVEVGMAEESHVSLEWSTTVG